MGFWSRLRRTFRSDRHGEEIEEELQYHLAMKQQEGCDPRMARVQFGGLTKIKEDVRAEGVLPWLESCFRDARYALRQMRKAPLFTLALVLSLALGIGANAAIFNVVYAALLKPLPVPDPQALRVVEWVNAGFPGRFCNLLSGDTEGDEHRLLASSVSVHVYRELARRQHGFTSLMGFSDSSTAAVAVQHQPAERFRIQYVSLNFFTGLEVPLRLGRGFSASDDREGQPPVVILSDRFWQNKFAGRADVLGQVLRVNNVPVEVVGIVPAGFFGLQIGEWVDMYAPLAADTALNPRAKLDESFRHTDRYWWVRMMGRLKPGVAESQAVGELSALFRRSVAPPGAEAKPGQIPTLIALPGERGIDPIRPEESRALWIVFLLVGLILLIVCANVANLLLSRTVVRQRESAVCLALGAGRGRLFRQYLTETLLLAACGGCAGLLLSYLLADALDAFIRADMSIGGFDLHANAQVLAFTCVVSLATALLCGVSPSWILARSSVHDALKANSRTVLGGRLRIPRLLVVAQIALSFTVLVAAGLLGRSLTNLRNVPIGFSRGNLVYASADPWSAGYQPAQVRSYADRLRSTLASAPGIQRVAMVEERPLSGDANASAVNVPGRSFNAADTVLVNHVSDGFFETLGVPLIAGRTFSRSDMNPNSDAVIVDDLFARRFFAGRNPIGEQFGLGATPKMRYRVIGVVRNSRSHSLRKANEPEIFRPYHAESRPGWNVSFVVRSSMSTGQVARSFERLSRTIDPAVPVIAIETQTQLIDSLLRSERLLSIFSAAFGILALLLSAIGLLGLLGYMIARRTNEIGVRVALGASRRRVAGMVMKDAFVLLTFGLAAGLPGAFAVARLLKQMLFHLRPADPLVITSVVATMALVTALASSLPSVRAARVDPVIALREE